MRQPKTKKHLRCPLTDAEIIAASRRLADLIAQTAQLKDDKKRVAKDFDSRVATITGEANIEHAKVLNGFECRDVDCSVMFDFPRRGMKRITRDDTGEEVEVSRMTADELQDELPLDGKRNTAPPAGAPETAGAGSAEADAPEAPAPQHPPESDAAAPNGNPWQWLDGVCLKPAKVLLEPDKGLGIEIAVAQRPDGRWASGLDVFDVTADTDWALKDDGLGAETAADAVSLAVGLAQVYLGKRKDKLAKTTLKWTDQRYGDVLQAVNDAPIAPGFELTLDR